jgi:hypothetical protein
MNVASGRTATWRPRALFCYGNRRSLSSVRCSLTHSYRQAYLPHNRRGLRRQTVTGGFAWLLAVGLIAGSSARAATVNFFDGIFNNGDWSAAKIADTTAGSSATFSALQQPAGGNPTFYRQTTHNWTLGGLRVGHLRNVGGSPFTYTPSSQGAINTIDISYDLIYQQGPAGAVGYGLLLRQNGKYYSHPIDSVFANSWSTFSHIGFTNTSFSELLVPGLGVNPLSNPDFSAAGSLIEFGYQTSNSHGNSGVIVTKVSGIDNYGLTLHTVPEPASVISMIVGAVSIGGFAMWRKRRMNAGSTATALVGTN